MKCSSESIQNEFCHQSSSIKTNEKFEWTTLLRQWRNSCVKLKIEKTYNSQYNRPSSSPSSSSSSVILVSISSIFFWWTVAICLLSQSQETGAKQSSSSDHVFSNEFALHIPSGDERANEIAAKHGWKNLGQIGSLPNHYLFDHHEIHKRSLDISHDHHRLLEDEPDVLWFEQQVEKKRTKRDFSYFEGPSGTGGPFFSTAHSFQPPSTYQTIQNVFLDPLYKEQWYLTAGSKDGFDMNVQAAWKRGYTGKGVVVSILDDGIQPNHPDLILNYDPRASTDINDNDLDPTPQDNGDNKHGTRCAGEVAAQAGNNICGVGVAYNASIGGVRMLDGTVNDAVEAKALGLNPDHVDIYSASWGPEDDGKTVDGPGPLARRAFIYGVTNGRRGLGSIFIWASGNGGRHVDSCNCDGYTNSIFTLSISSATQGGYKPWYLEECASTLATTYSSGTPTLDKSVATVDMDGRLRPDHICTVEHTGTSASAPLAAGMVALALEANRNLSWRDLQHLVVMTSRADPLDKEDGWYVNGVSRKFSHKFGYGLMDAGAMVDLAVNWAGVPPQHICKSREIREDREIPGAHLGKVKVFMDVDGCAGTNSEIRFLEHVQCKISLRFFPRGNLRILLTSPMGTSSVLLFERPRDVSSSNFDDWPFLSVHFWGEQAHGRWTLEIINSGSRRINQPGIVKKWQLILYGTDVNPVRLRSRSLQNSQQPIPYDQRMAQTQNMPHQQYHDPALPSLVPRMFVPREYLYPGASENVPQIQKPQNIRSQCQHEFWVPDLTICVNDCPEGYFSDMSRKECLPCQTRCKSCYNTTSCTACEHNLVLFGTSCLPICPEGYYEADSSCELCQLSTCGSCAGAMGSECVRCKNGYVLHQNQCILKCPIGFRMTSFNECVECSVGCHSCDEIKCLECSNGYQSSLDGIFCTETNVPCPVGLFLNVETNQCGGCGREECLHCIGAEECIECKEGLLVYKGDCIPTCWPGLYPSSNKKECFPCPKLCTKCFNSEICTECRGDGMLQEGKCLPHCSDGFFNDMGVCNQCSTGCKTCIGKGETDCVTCNSGYKYLKGGSCVQSNSLIKDRSPGNSCPSGFWSSPRDNNCLPCHASCSRCSGSSASNCRSCVTPLRLDRGTSRCIDCCLNTEDQDCCHCEAKHHTEHTKTVLTSEYNAECHVVARRVSEDEKVFQNNDVIGGGKWSDSTALSIFCLSVFLIVATITVLLHKRRRKFNSIFLSSIESDFEVNRGKQQQSYHVNGKGKNNHHKSLLYEPVNSEENLGHHSSNNEIEGNHQSSSRFFHENEDDKDSDYSDDEESPEETPLVLKT